MAMRKVTENEIWGGSDRGVQEPISLEFLISHVPKKYAPLVSKIHHVDTQLRENFNPDTLTEDTYWRVQGYISMDDFVEWSNLRYPLKNDIQANIYIPNKEIVEIWILNIPYESNRPRVKKFQ